MSDCHFSFVGKFCNRIDLLQANFLPLFLILTITNIKLHFHCASKIVCSLDLTSLKLSSRYVCYGIHHYYKFIYSSSSPTFTLCLVPCISLYLMLEI
ncbi:hypothetical protein QUC31_015121 [Theobroma cacao]